MKVPPIGTFGTFGVLKQRKTNQKSNFIEPLKNDTVSFTSNAKYIKMYATLPDEIKKILSPQDAIDMFKNMEWIANGVVKGKEVGEGEYSKVYKSPWFPVYFILILFSVNDDDKITIFSGENVVDSIWQSDTDWRLQILKRSA